MNILEYSKANVSPKLTKIRQYGVIVNHAIHKMLYNPQNLTDRIVYYDFLRIISMFAVIVLHTAGERWSKVEVHSLAWNSFNFYDSIVRWAVPVFTMISGALFLAPPL